MLRCAFPPTGVWSGVDRLGIAPLSLPTAGILRKASFYPCTVHAGAWTMPPWGIRFGVSSGVTWIWYKVEFQQSPSQKSDQEESPRNSALRGLSSWFCYGGPTRTRTWDRPVMSRMLCERSGLESLAFCMFTQVPFYAVSQVPVGVPVCSIDFRSTAALRSLCDRCAYRSDITTEACRSNLLTA
jgi:hypothetical protein